MIPGQYIYNHRSDRTHIIFNLATESRVFGNTLFTLFSNED